MAKNAGICDGRKYQTANINCSGQTTVTTGVQPCELVATVFRDNRENRKQVYWEPVKIESVSGASLKKKKIKTSTVENQSMNTVFIPKRKPRHC